MVTAVPGYRDSKAGDAGGFDRARRPWRIPRAARTRSSDHTGKGTVHRGHPHCRAGGAWATGVRNVLVSIPGEGSGVSTEPGRVAGHKNRYSTLMA